MARIVIIWIVTATISPSLLFALSLRLHHSVPRGSWMCIQSPGKMMSLKQPAATGSQAFPVSEILVRGLRTKQFSNKLTLSVTGQCASWTLSFFDQRLPYREGITISSFLMRKPRHREAKWLAHEYTNCVAESGSWDPGHISGQVERASGSTWPSAFLHLTEEGTRPREGRWLTHGHTAT